MIIKCFVSVDKILAKKKFREPNVFRLFNFFSIIFCFGTVEMNYCVIVFCIM